MKQISIAALIALFAVVITGCNTIQGVGKDVKAGGQAIESAAEAAKPKPKSP